LSGKAPIAPARGSCEIGLNRAGGKTLAFKHTSIAPEPGWRDRSHLRLLRAALREMRRCLARASPRRKRPRKNGSTASLKRGDATNGPGDINSTHRLRTSHSFPVASLDLIDIFVGVGLGVTFEYSPSRPHGARASLKPTAEHLIRPIRVHFAGFRILGIVFLFRCGRRF